MRFSDFFISGAAALCTARASERVVYAMGVTFLVRHNSTGLGRLYRRRGRVSSAETRTFLSASIAWRRASREKGEGNALGIRPSPPLPPPTETCRQRRRWDVLCPPHSRPRSCTCCSGAFFCPRMVRSPRRLKRWGTCASQTKSRSF